LKKIKDKKFVKTHPAGVEFIPCGRTWRS